MSFQIAIEPNRRAATRFVGKVRRGLQKLFVDNPEITRSQVADAIDVHRSVITRQLNGGSDISLARVAEIAWAVGYRPSIKFEKIGDSPGCNLRPASAPAYSANFVAVQSSTSDEITISGATHELRKSNFVEAV